MNKVRAWLIRKLGGHPYLPTARETRMQIERIPMETRKVYASVEYFEFHRPPNETLEIWATDKLARELYKSGLVHFDYLDI